MIRHAFVTVTDYSFFPGTLATVNSILEFHPDSEVQVVVNQKHPLTRPQVDCLRRSPRVNVIDSCAFDKPGRHINAWELKAYAAYELSSNYDVLIGIDSDCILCANVDDVIERCNATGGFLGGQDGAGADYDESYAPYGFPVPAHNPKYMSTSLFFCAVTDATRHVLWRWAECCGQAVFNGTGPLPGHGDQGVLNAVLYAEGRTGDVELLDNRIWSQHWTYWDSIIDFRNGEFINLSAGGLGQRSFHCGGAEKYWNRDHRDKVLDKCSLQTYPYLWFVSMFWFGKCGDWSIDPFQYLPPSNVHLIDDLILFFPQIMQVYPQARTRWNGVSDSMLDRFISGIPRALSLGGGSMSEVIELVEADPTVRRYAEIGSYEAGSILTLALRFLNRDIDFYSIESFMGNLNGTMDGHRLPSRRKFLENMNRFPTARVSLIPGDSGLAASHFDDASLDFIFIDACHDTPAVLRDIDLWMPKVAEGGIVAGDDYNWDTVSAAVALRFPEAKITPSGNVWWVRK